MGPSHAGISRRCVRRAARSNQGNNAFCQTMFVELRISDLIANAGALRPVKGAAMRDLQRDADSPISDKVEGGLCEPFGSVGRLLCQLSRRIADRAHSLLTALSTMRVYS